jgi:NhaP-type Na+/H+ or K+/H+ antiporter
MPRMSGWTPVVVAAVVLVYAAFSRRLEASVVSAAIFFVTVGLALGNKGLDWIDISDDGHAIRTLAEITLTLVLFADASRIDLRTAWREYRVPALLLGIGLPLTILAGWGAGLVIFGGIAGAEALILAVILAPTDAALGQIVVTDSRLPSRVRQSLNVESGLNDGLCVPVLLVALAIAASEEGKITGHHALKILVEEIGGGTVAGLVAGTLAALIVILAVPRHLIRGSWLQVVPVGAAGLSYALAVKLDGSGFIAAFVGGLVFGGLHRRTGGDVNYLIDELGELTNAVTFLVFGAVFVGPMMGNLTWSAGLYAVLSLTAVRMVPVALALRPVHARRQTAGYIGWFGPRGLASIVFIVIAVEGAGLPNTNVIVNAVVATITLSVYAHGLSARPLTDRYVRWYQGHPRHERPQMESVHVHQPRWRHPSLGPAGVSAAAAPAHRTE